MARSRQWCCGAAQRSYPKRAQGAQRLGSDVKRSLTIRRAGPSRAPSFSRARFCAPRASPRLDPCRFAHLPHSTRMSRDWRGGSGGPGCERTRHLAHSARASRARHGSCHAGTAPTFEGLLRRVEHPRLVRRMLLHLVDEASASSQVRVVLRPLEERAVHRGSNCRPFSKPGVTRSRWRAATTTS